jgi:hypothetical protein
MTQYDNTNTGVVFKNDRKAEDWHPEYRGTINVEGKEYFIDLKIRDGKNGKFFSAKLKRKDRPSGGKAVPSIPTSIPRPPEPVADFDDSIPF